MLLWSGAISVLYALCMFKMLILVVLCHVMNSQGGHRTVRSNSVEWSVATDSGQRREVHDEEKVETEVESDQEEDSAWHMSSKSIW